MTTQTDMVAALKSTDGRKAQKDAVLAALTSPEGKTALMAPLLAALTSPEGKKALRAPLLEALKSTDGKDTLRSAVQAELGLGFANHKAEDDDKKEDVFYNQEWLFDAVQEIKAKV
jgi:hypothetical protein